MNRTSLDLASRCIRSTACRSYRSARLTATTTSPKSENATAITIGLRSGGGIAERSWRLRTPDPPELETCEQQGRQHDQADADERAVQPEDEEAEQRCAVLD